MATKKAVPAPSTMLAMEQIGLQLKPTSGPFSIPVISSAAATTGLKVITGPNFPMLVVEPDSIITSPTSLVASTLVSMKLLLGCYLFPCSADGCPCNAFNDCDRQYRKDFSFRAHSLARRDRSREGVCGIDDRHLL